MLKLLNSFIVLIFFSGMVHTQGFNMLKRSNIVPSPGQSYGGVFGYKDAQNNEYAIIGSQSAIHIYNVNNCSSPLHVASHADGHSTIWREFATYQNYVYSVCDGNCGSGLTIVNMNNQSVIRHNTVFTKAHTIFIEVAHGRLYVMGSRNALSQDRLLIYTLDTEVVNGVTYNGTPESPVLIREFLTPYIHDMFVKDNIGYASLIYNFIYWVWDMNNPASITETHNYYHDSGKYNHSSWMHNDGQTLFEAVEIPRGENIYMYRKVANNSSLQYVGGIREPLEFPISNQVRYHNPHINGNYMYVSAYEDGVQVFDVSNVSTANSVKRIAYYDTYHQNNGTGYTNNYYGCWGTYPYLPSGCILASDINNGLFTLQLELPAPEGNNPGLFSLSKNTDIIFESSNKGVVLRSENGYCYRLKITDAGDIITERIVCDSNGQSSTKLDKNDIAFDNHQRGIILKNNAGNCRKLKITGSQLVTEITPCTLSTNQVNFQTGDLIINTPTKGFILKDQNSNCHRVLVKNDGQLSLIALHSCP
jgi:choice-of-anchor B domain-containing protein